ncbi:MAG: hypothetical protein ACAH83_12760 [Alphaproteobacteria bacterium]
MDSKNTGSDDDRLSGAFNGAAPDGAALESLKESLRKAVFGQQDVIDRLASSAFKTRSGASTILIGPKGAGKTSVSLDAFKRGTMAQPGTIIILDEIHSMDQQALHDAINAALGPTREEQGEMAAEEFRNGAANSVTCMKPLRYKRGFFSLTF